MVDQQAKPDRQRTIQLVGTIISLALLGYVLFQQDWQELLRLAAGIPIFVFVIGLILLSTRVIAHAMRWLTLLRAQGIHLGISATLRLQWAGFFAGNFLPTSVGGDVVRLYGVLPASPSKVVALASIAVDRAMGVIGMLFFLPFSIPLLASIFAGTLSIAQLGLIERARAAFEHFVRALTLWKRQPRSLFVALMASFAGILCFLLAIYLLAISLGIPVDFADVAGASVLTYFIALIPFSINAYGLRELGVVFFYTRLGATSEQALALALLSRALFLLVSLPGALFLPKVLSSRNSDGIQ